MKHFKIVFVSIVTLAILGAASFLIYGYLKPKPGGLKIVSTPRSRVYVNNEFVGTTPYTGNREAGQVNLKLIPDVPKSGIMPYESVLNLVSGIQTVVEREFGETDDVSGGALISFEKTGGKLAGLVVITNPDGAQVWIDGISQGVSPYNFNSITTGPHTVTIKNPGYVDRSMNIKTLAGLKLNIFVKLSKAVEQLPTPTPSPAPASLLNQHVLIGTTPTGYLRMRTEPDTKGEEIAELKTGQKYLYLGTDTATGWHNIQYQPPAPGLPNGIKGWVSGQYSKVIDDKGNAGEIVQIVSPTSSPQLSGE